MEFLARNLTKDSSLLFHAKSLRLAYFKENYTLVKNTHLRHFYLLKKFENISKLFAVQCKDQRIRVRTEQLCKRMIRCTAGYFKYFSSNQFCQIISLNSTKRICFSTDLAMTRRNPPGFSGNRPPPSPPPLLCFFFPCVGRISNLQSGQRSWTLHSRRSGLHTLQGMSPLTLRTTTVTVNIYYEVCVGVSGVACWPASRCEVYGVSLCFLMYSAEFMLSMYEKHSTVPKYRGGTCYMPGSVFRFEYGTVAPLPSMSITEGCSVFVCVSWPQYLCTRHSCIFFYLW